MLKNTTRALSFIGQRRMWSLRLDTSDSNYITKPEAVTTTEYSGQQNISTATIQLDEKSDTPSQIQ
ncbi:SEC62 [Acrasis kona]|uniref:SEC62 n=1 Tax=Acrasis kona TaxID=1008807 RepID=A0AAW2ZB41_9EUKA